MNTTITTHCALLPIQSERYDDFGLIAFTYCGKRAETGKHPSQEALKGEPCEECQKTVTGDHYHQAVEIKTL